MNRRPQLEWKRAVVFATGRGLQVLPALHLRGTQSWKLRIPACPGLPSSPPQPAQLTDPAAAADGKGGRGRGQGLREGQGESAGKRVQQAGAQSWPLPPSLPGRMPAGTASGSGNPEAGRRRGGSCGGSPRQAKGGGGGCRPGAAPKGAQSARRARCGGWRAALSAASVGRQSPRRSSGAEPPQELAGQVGSGRADEQVRPARGSPPRPQVAATWLARVPPPPVFSGEGSVEGAFRIDQQQPRNREDPRYTAASR